MTLHFKVVLYLLAFFCVVVLADEKSKSTPDSSASGSSPVIQGNNIQKFLAIRGKHGQVGQRSLKRVFLSNRSITCNDGTPSGFYLRKSHGSTKWIMFLEGGFYCHDQESCRSRWQQHRFFMTSSQWTESRNVGGILSASKEENPFWWDANHVFVPYCTSDSWSGTQSQPNEMFSFMGAEIVSQVVKDLIQLGLDSADSFLLAGSSAGGTGVMLNLDHVRNLIHQDLNLSHVSVRGVSDSGWFLDQAPFSINSQTNLSPIETIKQGMNLWNARLPPNCVAQYPTEQWKCYFGFRLYPTLNAPLFVFQWLFDHAQMDANNVAVPSTKQQWNYVHAMGDNLRQTFDNVTAVFAPSCIGHNVLTRSDWQLVKIKKKSFAQALHCWEKHIHFNETNSQLKSNQSCSNSSNDKIGKRGQTRKSDSSVINENSTNNNNKNNNNSNNNHSNNRHRTEANVKIYMSDVEGKENKSTNETNVNERRRRRRKHRRDRQRGRVKNKDGKDRKENHHQGRKKDRQQSNKHIGDNHTTTLNRTRSHRIGRNKNKQKCGRLGCHFRLIEQCNWPQCSNYCPKYKDPNTGKEMDVIELFKNDGMNSDSFIIGIRNDFPYDESISSLSDQLN